MMKNVIYILITSLYHSSVVIITSDNANGFTHPVITKPNHNAMTLFAKRGKKLSFAQKKKRRQRRQTMQPPPQLEQPSSPVVPPPLSKDITDSSAETFPQDKDGSVEKQTAAKLIESQRKSVAMLTHVRQCIENLPVDEIISTLKTQKYYVKDDFLGFNVEEMEEESRSLFQNGKLELMEVGYGEYSTLLTGGDSYADSPRCTEFVVGTTRHLPPLFNNEGFSVLLDDKASMGSILAFDRKSYLSSLELLTTSKDDSTIPPRPSQYINTNPDHDERFITLYYYLVSDQWDDDCKGGITFFPNEKEEKGVVVSPKKDRLIIFRSDEALHRREYWKGNDDVPFGSCLILHLIKARS